MRLTIWFMTAFVILNGHQALGANECEDEVAGLSVATLPEDLVQFPPPTPWIQETSEANNKRLAESGMAEVDAQLKSLSYKQAIQETHFQNGSVYTEAGNLIWKSSEGTTTVLASESEHPDRGITFLAISPDGKKIAYSTTLSGSDQHVWYVKSIEQQPRHLLAQPILVRMDGFSWGQDSETVYYSHFAKIEDVIAGKKPIQVARSRNIRTGEDRLVFDHGTRANFVIFDVDNGQTLLAHRVLGPGSGIKALLSIYRGEKSADGSYTWSPLIEPNRYIGHFLGVIRKAGVDYAVMHTNRFTKRYGIAMVPVRGKAKGISPHLKVYSPPSDLVLHNSQMHEGQLFLEFYNPKTLRTSLKIVEAQTGAELKSVRFSDFGLLDIGSLGLPVAFNGGVVTVKFVDVLGGTKVFSYDPRTSELKALENPEANPFDSKNVRVSVVSYPSKGGVTVRALKIYPVDAKGKPLKPKFFFLKSYGMIGIKSPAEATEAQMTTLRGGVYIVPDIRGGAGPNSDWQVSGSRDFDLRYADIRATAKFITKMDPMYSQYGFKAQESVILVGRSYNGSGVLEMAARYPNLAKMFVSIVPVWDFEIQMNQGRFGVMSHSDRFPDIDPATRDLDLNGEFWSEIARHNPANWLTSIAQDTRLYVYTGGRDDRVDLLTVEEGFARLLSERLGSNFRYIQNPTASHIPRWYMGEMFTEIDLVFKN